MVLDAPAISKKPSPTRYTYSDANFKDEMWVCRKHMVLQCAFAPQSTPPWRRRQAQTPKAIGPLQPDKRKQNIKHKVRYWCKQTLKYMHGHTWE
jgi:hypothetical protein